MDGLEPIDRDNLGPLLEPHWPLLAQVHAARTRMFGLGGAATLALAVVAPIAVAAWTEPSAFQIALVAIGAVLVGLGVVRALARAQGNKLRGRVQSHCLREGADLDEIVAAARKTQGRLYFFAALWDDPAVDKK